MNQSAPTERLVNLPILNAHWRLRSASRVAIWLRRLGLVGMLFFLVKGLLWLLVPTLVAHGLFGPAR